MAAAVSITRLDLTAWELRKAASGEKNSAAARRILALALVTVSREMSRNGGCDRYRAALADENAWARTRRPKCCKLANNPRLRRTVAGKLRLDWSPEQIAGWLKRTHPEDGCNQVSRDDLPQLICTNTWRAQERAAQSPSIEALDASLPAG